MDDDIQAEIERLQAYAEASGKTFETVAAEALVTYQRSLRTTRQALADIQQHVHFERYPLAPLPE